LAFVGINQLQARDEFHNLIIDYATDPGLVVTITVSSGELSFDSGSNVVTATAFIDGEVDLTGRLVYTGTAGTVTFTATNGLVSSAAVTVTIEEPLEEEGRAGLSMPLDMANPGETSAGDSLAGSETEVEPGSESGSWINDDPASDSNGAIGEEPDAVHENIGEHLDAVVDELDLPGFKIYVPQVSNGATTGTSYDQDGPAPAPGVDVQASTFYTPTYESLLPYARIYLPQVSQ
jgi:hypothetical protein